MPPCDFCSKGPLNGLIPEDHGIPMSQIRHWTYPFSVSMHKSACPKLAAGEPGLPAPVRAAPTTHRRAQIGGWCEGTDAKLGAGVSSETNEERNLL